MRNEIPRKLGMTVRFPPPLDIDASLALFRRSGDDLIDRWDGVHLVRTAPVGGQTVAYCCTLAGGVDRRLADCLTLAELECLSDEQVIATLTAIRGIGRWSAEWILARTLGRPVVVAGDLGVRKAVGLAYLNDPLPSEHQVRRATTH